MSIKVNCLVCFGKFETINSIIKKGGGKYCSNECRWESMREKRMTRKCLLCKKIFQPSLQAVKNGKGYYCSSSCSVTFKNKENVFKWQDRFHKTVDKQGGNKCWIWLGSKDKDGYGRFYTKLLNTSRAHKVSYILHFGNVKNGMIICHTCDIPSCVNPKHLYSGTPNDNAQDKINRGRDLNTRGAKHHNAKLNDNTVKRLKERMKNGESCSMIARELEMNQSSINAIKNSKTWKHLE